MKPNILSKTELAARVRKCSRALCCVNCRSLLLVFGLVQLPERLAFTVCVCVFLSSLFELQSPASELIITALLFFALCSLEPIVSIFR